MKCSNCNENLSNDSVFCPNCGTKVEGNMESENVRTNYKAPEGNSISENLKKVGFFSFDKMITPTIIKIIFIIGIILTTLSGLGLIVMGMDAYYGGGSMVFVGLLTLVIGPIFVRVYCELMIVVFKMHEALEDIRRKN